MGTGKELVNNEVTALPFRVLGRGRRLGVRIALYIFLGYRYGLFRVSTSSAIA